MSTTTKIAGLWTNPNDARAPEGALAVADNVVLSRPGVAEPRRGFTAQNTALGEAINAYAYFDGYLVAHTGTGTLRRSSNDGASWTSYSGTYSPPDASTKVRFWQSSGSLFFTSADGVYELDDATGTPRLTGVVRAQDGAATLVKTSANGWMEPDTQVAYRVAWLYRNANEKVQYGGPSGRFLVSNPAASAIAIAGLSKANGGSVVVATETAHTRAVNDYVTIVLGGAETYFAAGTFIITAITANTFTYSDALTNSSGSTKTSTNASTAGVYANVSLSIPIPSGITTSYALQVFRSGQSVTSSTEPSDSLGLVYEAVPTNVDITAGSITVSDVTPDTMRGVDWQDVISGGTAHERTPICNDAALWRGVTFCADTLSAERATFRLLSLSGINATGTVSTIVVGDSSFHFISAGTSESGTTFKVYTTGSTAQNIADTARSIVRTINRNTSTFERRAYYVSGETDAPGEFVIEKTVSNANTWAVWIVNGSGRSFAPEMFARFPLAIGNLVRVGTTVTATTSAPHYYVVGEQITLQSFDAKFAFGVKTITGVTSTTVTWTEAGTAGASTIATGLEQTWEAPTVLADDYPNSIMWSAPDEPWAVSLFNQAFVGSEGTTILRIVPTRDKVLIFTDAGIYQLFGDYPNFAIAELDTTVHLAAYNTAVALGGRVFALSTQGVVEVQDSARVVSVAIDDALRDLLANYSSNLALRAFAVAYESERQLLLWLPDDASDAYSAQAFVYHLDSQQWTRWTVSATTGFVHPTQDRLYLGHSTTGLVWKENKSRAASDHAEPPDTALSVAYSALDGAASTVTVASSAGFSVGDSVTDASIGGGTTITAINGNVLTVGDTSELVAPGTLTLLATGIDSVVEWAPLMPAGPGVACLADLGSLDFQEANFSSASMQFATNLSPTLSSAETVAGAASNAPAEVAFVVPQAQQRGTRYRVRFAHSLPSERYQLQGLALRFRKTSGRPNR